MDVVTNYAEKKGGSFDDKGNLSINSMMNLVEALSGYKLKLEDSTSGAEKIKTAAKQYDDSKTEYVGVLKADWSSTSEKDDAHFMGLVGQKNGTLEVVDSSRRNRRTDNDFRRDVGEVSSRLDTYSFSSDGTIDSSFKIDDYLPKTNSSLKGGNK